MTVLELIEKLSQLPPYLEVEMEHYVEDFREDSWGPGWDVQKEVSGLRVDEVKRGRKKQQIVRLYYQ